MVLLSTLFLLNSTKQRAMESHFFKKNILTLTSKIYNPSFSKSALAQQQQQQQKIVEVDDPSSAMMLH